MKYILSFVVPPNTTATLQIAGIIKELKAGSYEFEFPYASGIEKSN
jgi:hypothetical protein